MLGSSLSNSKTSSFCGQVRRTSQSEEAQWDFAMLSQLKKVSATRAMFAGPEPVNKPVTGRNRDNSRHGRVDRRVGSRYLSQPTSKVGSIEPPTSPDHDTSSSAAAGGRRAMSYAGTGQSRRHTQPVTTGERREAEVVERTGSIAERLSSLKKSGEENWKKRVTATSSCPPGVSSKEPSPEPGVAAVQMRVAQPRTTTIAHRLSKLTESQDTWKSKVDEKDVKQFTVEGKMERRGKTTESPLTVRKHKTPRKMLSRESESSDGGMASPLTPLTPVNDPLLSIPNMDTPPHDPAKSMPEMTGIPVEAETRPREDGVKEEGDERRVVVPQLDQDSLREFFTASPAADSRHRQLHSQLVTMDDLEHVAKETHDMLPHLKRVRAKKSRMSGVMNPLRALAGRDDVVQEYTEVSTGVTQREMNRIEREQVVGLGAFTHDALAGLAAKEDFAKANLRKTDSFKGLSDGKYVPFKSLMLLQVKGRRRCETRLVEPVPASINSGDCYILVTPTKLYVWFGEFCNVIERAKAVEVAAVIHQKRDLGCKSSTEPLIIEEKKNKEHEQFWGLLGGYAEYPGPGPTEEDEDYEECVSSTNIVYRVDVGGVEPLDEYWGKPLKYHMLQDNQSYVFDFGSEMYIWLGKHCTQEVRRLATKKAQELWDLGYDYTECDLNPIWPLQGEEHPKKSPSRPEWGLIGKVPQQTETILFREKFVDWPDPSRLIAVKPDTVELEVKDINLTPYDAQLMVAPNTTPVSMVLDGVNVGRGDKWVDLSDGLRREYQVTTLDVDVWLITEFDRSKLDPSQHGQFYEGNTYVIRWYYMIKQTGLKSSEAGRGSVGRHKIVYFFWQGGGSTVNEKGASALMTVELDTEEGPQVRVVQNKEPPCFLQLFAGKMLVHRGRRGETVAGGRWRLYLVRHECHSEAHLLEVSCEVASLRSRGSFLLVNDGAIYVWHGDKATKETQTRARELAEFVQKERPTELDFGPDVRVEEVLEGEEPCQFWSGLGGRDRSLYHSLLHESLPCSAPRLFHMSSISGQFDVEEGLNPCRRDDVHSLLPFTQADLYKHSQPALCLVDGGGGSVYLWQGYWPAETEDGEVARTTGWAGQRFTQSRVCALQTTLDYCHELSGSRSTVALVVYAGLEPLEFTNLFPFWSPQSEAADSSTRDGHMPFETTSAIQLLNQLQNMRYSYEQLQLRPLPDGVHSLRLESYLSDEEFREHLEMEREEFYSLPHWKQIKLKRNVNLC